MKRYWILVFCMLFSGMAFSQSRFTGSVSGGYNFDINSYYNENGYKKYENANIDFNVGIDAGFRFSKLVRLRVEMRYSENSYGRKMISSSTGEEVNYRTESTLNNLDINPRLDFRVFSFNKFDFYLSPGIRLEYVLNQNQNSYKPDGSSSNRNNYIKTNYNNSLSGAVGGVLMRYNVNKRVGITFAPDYTIFFNKLYDSSDKTMMRINANIGVEFVL